MDSSVVYLEVLAEVSRALSREPEHTKAVCDAFDVLVPRLASWCAVRTAADPALGGEGPDVGAPPEPQRADVAALVARVTADGVPQQTSTRRLRLVAVPLLQRAEVSGALILATRPGSPDDGFTDFAVSLGALVGLRLEADAALAQDWSDDPGAQDQRLTLRPQPESAAVARAVVRDALARAGLSGHTDTAVLLVSELVSNALRHGLGAPELHVHCDELGLLVSVGDHSPSSPRPRRPLHDTYDRTVPAQPAAPADVGEPAALDEDGRGLLLVEALADDWGWTGSPRGKRVWFRLSR